MKTSKRRPRSPAKRNSAKTSRVDTLFDEGMKLPPRERRKLVDLLADTLPELGVAQAEIDACWEAEIKRRLDEVDSGRVKPIPAAEVHRRIEERLRVHSQRRVPPRR
jgi:putative addiction module component (TIGR02574 family)